MSRDCCHAGDSACSIPPQTIPEECLDTIRDWTTKLAKALKVIGLINIQYCIQDNEVLPPSLASTNNDTARIPAWTTNCAALHLMWTPIKEGYGAFLHYQSTFAHLCGFKGRQSQKSLHCGTLMWQCAINFCRYSEIKLININYIKNREINR